MDGPDDGSEPSDSRRPLLVNDVSRDKPSTLFTVCPYILGAPPALEGFIQPRAAAFVPFAAASGRGTCMSARLTKFMTRALDSCGRRRACGLEDPALRVSSDGWAALLMLSGDSSGRPQALTGCS